MHNLQVVTLIWSPRTEAGMTMARTRTSFNILAELDNENCGGFWFLTLLYVSFNLASRYVGNHEGEIGMLHSGLVW